MGIFLVIVIAAAVDNIDDARPFRTYRGVRFTRSQIYLLLDVSAIQNLTNSSVQVWSLANARKTYLLDMAWKIENKLCNS